MPQGNNRPNLSVNRILRDYLLVTKNRKGLSSFGISKRNAEIIEERNKQFKKEVKRLKKKHKIFDTMDDD